jgi:hypothetical protein
MNVVGVLKPGFAPLPDAYLVPASETTEAWFFNGDLNAYAATLVQLTEAQSHDRKLLQKLEKDLPAKAYTAVRPVDRLELDAIYLYLGGLAAFLLGGSGVIIELFRALAARAQRSKIADDVAPIDGLENTRRTRHDHAGGPCPCSKWTRGPGSCGACISCISGS